jgi:predicted ATPase
MITNIKVDGFRSLSGFSLKLMHGLNILVGPNGSGKTNIITFFEFLSNVVGHGASEAINILGGAGSVFGKPGGANDEFSHKISAVIIGSCKKKEREYINYKYNFCIEASSDFNKIFFSEQEIDIVYTKTFEQDYPVNVNDSFNIRQTLNNDKRKYVIKNFNAKIENPPIFHFISDKRTNKINEGLLEQFLDDLLEDEQSIITVLAYIRNGNEMIISDMRSGQVFNFIPSKIKIPEETSSTIGIKRDGSGLAATLYAIENKRSSEIKEQRKTFIFSRRNVEVDLEHVNVNDIIKYIRTANNSIEKLTVNNDRFENLLKIKFSINKDGKSIDLPITSMSDGTIKWVSFVTSILTSPTVFSIEEPENYLHPLMQSEVIKLMRNTIDGKGKLSSILMSTHSETILNSASPKEIIITEFVNGSTVAKRCSNVDDIVSEIKETGFGLGYYYISGSFEHE